MKALILALSVLASASAAAGEYTHFGRIFFQTASTWVPANSVCQSGGYFFHTKKDAVLVDVNCNNDSGTNCEKEARPLVQPIVSTREVCVRNAGGENEACIETATQTWIQSPVVPVAIYRNQKAYDRMSSPSRIVSYTIPACVQDGYTPAY